jgi:hypothetical protein
MLANVHMFTLSFLATIDNDCDDADIGKITSNYFAYVNVGNVDKIMNEGVDAERIQ